MLASSPPAPPRISTMTFLSSLGSRCDHRQADLLLEALDLRARGAEHLADLGVLALVEHLARAGLVVVRAPPCLGELRRRLELAVAPTGRGRTVAIPEDLGVGHRALRVGEARLDLLDESLDHKLEGSAGPFVSVDASHCCSGVSDVTQRPRAGE